MLSEEKAGSMELEFFASANKFFIFYSTIKCIM